VDGHRIQSPSRAFDRQSSGERIRRVGQGEGGPAAGYWRNMGPALIRATNAWTADHTTTPATASGPRALPMYD